MWWIALLEACHRDTPEAHTGVPQERSGCDPLVPEMCALPFPSGYFEREDDTQVTRRRLDYGEESLPVNRDAQQIDGRMLNHLDGYSTATPLLTYFAGVSLEGTIRHDHLEDYTAAEDQLVILYDPAIHPVPDVTVEPDPEDDKAVRVMIDGVVIARVLGDPDLTADQIELVAEDEVHAA